MKQTACYCYCHVSDMAFLSYAFGWGCSGQKILKQSCHATPTLLKSPTGERREQRTVVY